MRYRLFYEHRTIGDILMLVYEPRLVPDRVEEGREAALLYRGDALVGVNFLNVSRAIRLRAHGMIATPGEELLHVVNALLEENGIAPLPPTTDTGFHVLSVKKVEEHPLDERLFILTLSDGTKEIPTVSGLSPFREGDKVVCALPGTILRDGTLFEAGKDHGIPVEAKVLSPRDLALGEEEGIPFRPEGYEDGEDFYLPKEGK